MQLRYFYLITFASYFLERNNVLINNGTPPNGETETTFPPFSEWLANRREIMNIVSASPDLQ